MAALGLGDDERGLSESAGVALLVGITILVTASVGINVLVVEEEDTGPPSANFTYEYISESRSLLVTHSRGDSLRAGKLTFRENTNEVSWAALAMTNNSTMVQPGDIVQLSQRNAFGQSISTSSRIEVLYRYEGNQTKIDEWPTG